MSDIDELDWNRLRSGDLGALNPDHQDVFNMVFDLQAEIERLRDFIANIERGYKHFRDTAEAEYTRLHAEIEQLRMVTAPGSCECSPEEACGYARERDDARAEITRLRGLLHECLSFALGAPIGWSSDLWERVTKTLSDAPDQRD